MKRSRKTSSYRKERNKEVGLIELYQEERPFFDNL